MKSIEKLSREIGNIIGGAVATKAVSGIKNTIKTDANNPKLITNNKEVFPKITNNESETKNIFPNNPDELFPEIARNKIVRPNGTITQTIQTSDGIRIIAEQHPLLSREVYNPRHHGIHYHIEYKIDLNKSWNNKNNIRKLYPNDYINGSGFLPGETFPK